MKIKNLSLHVYKYLFVMHFNVNIYGTCIYMYEIVYRVINN